MATKQTNDLAIKRAVETNDEIQDVVLSLNKSKKRFRIDGDNAKIVELDVSDLGIAKRFNDIYPKLMAIESKLIDIANKHIDEDDTDALNESAMALDNADKEIRKLVDELFDTNLCEIVSPTGTMYDPIDGTRRYERIISTFMALYQANIIAETEKIKANVSKYAKKYSRKR